MIYSPQTPITQPTPQALIMYKRDDTKGQDSRKILEMSAAIKNNRFVLIGSDHPLASTWKRLEALYDLAENWNGYDVAAPNPDAIEHAKEWLQNIYLETDQDKIKWLTPHVSASEDGEVTFEWVKGNKRLTVYVSPKESIFIKSWGLSIVDEMIDGTANSIKDRRDLLAWLAE